MARQLLYIIILLTPCSFTFISAQQVADSVTAAGSHFRISRFGNFMMGTNYRKEWNTPVRVPVLNLAGEAGGLKPVKKGGGKQTKSLRLLDNNGREYTVRSIQKFITGKTLPADLQSEAAADLVADGVSASYPYAALSIPVLAQAAGVPHSNPRLVYITDDPRLGEFRKDFSHLMALFEERIPDTVKKEFSTDEVAGKLMEDNDNEADQWALLRARILDMFVMDFDRHEDQWLWGAYEKEKGKVFYPIARDRDQAFYINRGLIPGLIKRPWLVPQLEGLKAKASNINRFNFAARNLDRFFLNQLDEEDWKRAAGVFLSQMTDEAIEKALHQQPPEIQPVSAGTLVNILKDRRHFLMEELMQYYRFLSAGVSITGSDRKELFDINRNEDGTVRLRVFKISRQDEIAKIIYERKFDPAITREIRLYGMGNDDKFIVHGMESRIKIRIIGGRGKDEFVNTSRGNDIFLYDRLSEDNKLNGRFRNKMSDDTLVNSFNRIHYKYNQVIPLISAAYNRDDGLFLGASVKWIKHGFRSSPYRIMYQFSVNHALSSRAYNFRGYSEFIGVLGRKSDLLLEADLKAPHNTINFFGYGLNTIYDKSRPGKFRYYRARFDLLEFSVSWRKNISEKVKFILGPAYQYFALDSNDNRGKYILQTGANGLDPGTLFSKQKYLGGIISFIADTRDKKTLPGKGIVWTCTFRYLSGLNSRKDHFTQLNSEFTYYRTIMKGIILVNRFGGGHNWGNFEFYQSQFLGGEDHLRGYRKYRFAGRSKLFYNTELRIKAADFQTYLFPGALGFLAFWDAGNIRADKVSDTHWKTGYGGGIWFSPLSRIIITFSYTASKEDRLPWISLGWKF